MGLEEQHIYSLTQHHMVFGSRNHQLRQMSKCKFQLRFDFLIFFLFIFFLLAIILFNLLSISLSAQADLAVSCPLLSGEGCRGIQT